MIKIQKVYHFFNTFPKAFALTFANLTALKWKSSSYNMKYHNFLYRTSHVGRICNDDKVDLLSCSSSYSIYYRLSWSNLIEHHIELILCLVILISGVAQKLGSATILCRSKVAIEVTGLVVKGLVVLYEVTSLIHVVGESLLARLVLLAGENVTPRLRVMGSSYSSIQTNIS